MLQRLLILALLFSLELIVISIFLDNARLISRGGLTSLVGVWGAWILRSIVGFAALFVTFAYLKSKALIGQISSQVVGIPIGRALIAAHVFSMAIFGGLSFILYGGHRPIVSADLVAVSWLAAGVAAIASAGFAFIPFSLWVRLVRSTGYLWAYACIAMIAVYFAGRPLESLWEPATELTFDLVRAFLSPFVSGIISDPAKGAIGTHSFWVVIAPECSGLEGAALILAFGITWLWVFRKECRFPQALVLLPAGVALIFLLNAVRLAVLVLIGNAGARQIASGGFHSQAGWIAFNVVALGFSIAARRVPWLTVAPPEGKAPDRLSDNPTAAYLVPFLAILGAGMISSAAKGDFEWLYPLRFLAAGVTLWVFRRRYAALDWKAGWPAPAIGALVFILWIALDRFGQASDVIPRALATAGAPLGITWIAFRSLAAILTVPVAEELAFRGFLMRRLISADFDSLPPGTFTWFGLLVSSAAFGLLHGDRWFAGTLAGALYGLALVRRGRIGEAVVAHATTNALLAGYVLMFHKWHLW